MPEVRLHDGSAIDVEVHGTGPTVLLPVDPVPVEGPKADEMRKWGVDPAHGRSLIDGLSDAYRVVAFGYEAHVLAHPMPDTLTPDAIAGDLLAVADAVGADGFAYYGYSWLALAGLQLAIRTDRLTALVMGGFPPAGGPYAEMLRVTAATHAMAGSRPDASVEDGDWSTVEVGLTPDQTRQFVTLYEALRRFDDRTAVLTCPRLCFVGSADTIEYGERWGGVRISMAERIIGGGLEDLGWDVRVLDGLDHTAAMRASNVLPVVRPWLDAAL